MEPELVEATAAIESKHLEWVLEAVEAEKRADARVAQAEQMLAAARGVKAEARGEREGVVKIVGKLYGMTPPIGVDLKAATIKGMRPAAVPEVPASDETDPPLASILPAG